MKRTLRSMVVASLAIVAVAIAAATFDSTLEPTGASGDGGGGGGTGGGLFPAPQSGPSPGETVPIPLFEEVVTVLLMLALLALAVYVIIYRKEAAGTILGVLLIVGVIYLFFQVVSPPAALSQQPPMEPGNGSVLGGDSGGDGDERPPPTTPSVLVLLLVAAGVVGTVLVVFRSMSTEQPENTIESTTAQPDAAAVGQAAGRAADRIEEAADVNNEVYRAWQEMTELLEVDDATTKTPGEFATAAIEAGLGRDDVAALTELFEDVRYGTRALSAENEEHALEIFRRIERRYTEEESDS